MRLSGLATLLLIVISSAVAHAQSTTTDWEIDATRSGKDDFVNAPIQSRQPERKSSKQANALLAVPGDLKLTYHDFLRQRQTGITRLLPQGKYKGIVTVRGNGANYDFGSRSYGEFGDDIYLGADAFFNGPPGRAAFWAGSSGADFGFVVRLGDVSLDDVNLNREEARFLLNLAPPNNEQAAREQYRKNFFGVKAGGILYNSSALAEENTTCLLRSVRYTQSDLLIAFRAIRREPDGSFVILWKVLKKNPMPWLRGKAHQSGPGSISAPSMAR